MTFAFSVQDFVDQIGAYAGFAAAIGLALFALLLFAQARELKRLREWGAQAHDRMGELERRLAAALELARRASTSQRTMAPGAAQRPAPGAAAARSAVARVGVPGPALASTRSPTRLPLLPAAPARVAGAALGSATTSLALPKHPPGTAPPSAAPAPMPAPATSAPTVTPAVAPATPAVMPAAIPAAAAAEAAPSAAPAPSTPAPATAAAQGPAQPAPAVPTPPPAPPAGTNGHSDTFPPVPPVRRAPAPGRRVPPRAPARPAAAGARARGRPAPAAPLRARSAPSATPRGGGNGNGLADTPPHGRRRLALLLAGLGAVAVAAIVVLVLSGGGNDSPSSGSSGAPAGQATGAGSTPPAAAPAHDSITVAVLNGTTTLGLASTVADDLVADGFIRGPVTNASDQGRSVTVVSYFDGKEREAQEVAETLGVPSDAVGPIDADTETACAAESGVCTADAVVTVGADRQ